MAHRGTRWSCYCIQVPCTCLSTDPQRILALTGPSGAGKTATLRALAKDDALHFSLVEWDNRDAYYDVGESQSAVERFSAFLQSASRYTRLPLRTRHTQTSSASPRQVILVEDWPNLFHPGTRDGVHHALERFLTQHGAPLVLIVSDSVPRAEMEAWDDSQASQRRAAQMDVRVAVPLAVRQHPAFAEIRFNPLTTRMIQTALTPMAPSIPKHIVADMAAAASGDIRSAMNQVALWGAAGTSSDALARRESALAMFHALGRVLYNKRWHDPSRDKETLSVSQIQQCEQAERIVQVMAQSQPWRPTYRPSLVDVNEMWGQLPVDVSTFQLYLYHNMPAFTNEVDEMMHALDALSDADAYYTPSHPRAEAAAAPYLFHVTTRGVLGALPSPVPRRGQTLTKPAHWAWRERREQCEEVVAQVRMLPTDPMRHRDISSLQRCRAATLATEILPQTAPWYTPWTVLAAPLLAWHSTHNPHEEAPHDDLDAELEPRPRPVPQTYAPSSPAFFLHTCRRASEASPPADDDGGLSDELESLE